MSEQLKDVLGHRRQQQGRAVRYDMPWAVEAQPVSPESRVFTMCVFLLGCLITLQALSHQR
jgi:hypothetical protein